MLSVCLFCVFFFFWFLSKCGGASEVDFEFARFSLDSWSLQTGKEKSVGGGKFMRSLFSSLFCFVLFCFCSPQKCCGDSEVEFEVAPFPPQSWSLRIGKGKSVGGDFMEKFVFKELPTSGRRVWASLIFAGLAIVADKEKVKKERDYQRRRFIVCVWKFFHVCAFR